MDKGNPEEEKKSERERETTSMTTSKKNDIEIKMIYILTFR